MSLSPLLPERHPNQDFFIADIFDALPVKNDRHTMEHPFFALSTKKDIRTIRYERDGVKITLSPSAEWGLPTMMDKDILLYVGSLLMAEINRGRIPPKKVRFSAHDLLVTTNRHTNDIGYRMLKNAFERITGCMISTDIKTNNLKQSSGFHILESYDIIENSHDKKRMVRVEVTVSDWFYNALIGKEVLTINRAYFRLRKTLERRLYELARKHCGMQPKGEVGL
jgi:plasmid replication initiation protein